MEQIRRLAARWRSGSPSAPSGAPRAGVGPAPSVDAPLPSRVRGPGGWLGGKGLSHVAASAGTPEQRRTAVEAGSLLPRVLVGLIAGYDEPLSSLDALKSAVRASVEASRAKYHGRAGQIAAGALPPTSPDALVHDLVACSKEGTLDLTRSAAKGVRKHLAYLDRQVLQCLSDHGDVCEGRRLHTLKVPKDLRGMARRWAAGTVIVVRTV